MKWATALILAVVLICSVFGQQSKNPSHRSQRIPPVSESASTPPFQFEVASFGITGTGVLTMKDRKNNYALIPRARSPGELRSVLVLDFQDAVYVARFGEPGGVGVEGFYDVCFQIKDGNVLTHAFELGGSLERISDKVFVRSSSYVYDQVEKKVFRVGLGSPVAPTALALTNRLGPL